MKATFPVLAIFLVLLFSAAYAACGDNATEPGEACDGTDLGSYNCSSVAAGFASGTLGCKADCSGYDVSNCVQGNTINAASCSQADVQAAIDSAVDGDIVLVPEGDCTWTTPGYDILGDNRFPAIAFTKSIVLKGAGIGKTNITDGTGTAWHEILLKLEGQDGKPVRITGFTFIEDDKGSLLIVTDLSNGTF